MEKTSQKTTTTPFTICNIVVYFEHIRGFQKVGMSFPTAQKHEGKRGRGKKEGKKSKWKRRILKNFYHCSTILHTHLFIY
jgi:hypothetical protein